MVPVYLICPPLIIAGVAAPAVYERAVPRFRVWAKEAEFAVVEATNFCAQW
jgi:hypothetical protein